MPRAGQVKTGGGPARTGTRPAQVSATLVKTGTRPARTGTAPVAAGTRAAKTGSVSRRSK